MRLGFWILLVLALAGAVAWFFGPREPVAPTARFDPGLLDQGIDAYLYNQERRVPGIVRGAQKHVLWADPTLRDRRRLSVVYVHGFSATLEEVRPVPDLVARSLEANLFYTRLTGHGRDGAALAAATVPDWRYDLEEAIAIGRRLGEEVILMGTSTGGTLITLALSDPSLREDVAGVVFLSPNFGIKAEGAGFLTYPFARSFVPWLVGEERFFAPENPEHAKWWTERYPTVAVLPMAASVKAARAADLDQIDVPALFIFSDEDQVVDSAETRAVAAGWGGPVTIWPVAVGSRGDRSHHVIAGDILSPGMTDDVVERILEWVRERRI